MADGPHYNTHEVDRREHNDQAMAKRTLGIHYDYLKEEYGVPGLIEGGKVPVFIDPITKEQIERQTKLLGIIVKHLECMTQEVFTEEDLEDEYN
jgi:hypothetical protein